MGALRKRAEAIQQQLDRGERLSRSSDDPIAASRLRDLARAEKLSQADTKNANRATADLTLADVALTSFADYIIRARELAMRAANETLTDSQREGIGLEISQIHGSLVALANSRDTAGHALFGGDAAGDAYSLDASGNAVYMGTPYPGELPLGEGQSVTRGLTGPQFLTFDLNGTSVDLLATVKQLGDALQGGSANPVTSARDGLATLSAGLDAVTTGQTLVGMRLAWVDLTTERRVDLSELRATEQAEIGGTDIATKLVELQRVMVALEASQASFVKLSSLNLFNLVR